MFQAGPTSSGIGATEPPVAVQASDCSVHQLRLLHVAAEINCQIPGSSKLQRTARGSSLLHACMHAYMHTHIYSSYGMIMGPTASGSSVAKSSESPLYSTRKPRCQPRRLEHARTVVFLLWFPVLSLKAKRSQEFLELLDCTGLAHSTELCCVQGRRRCAALVHGCGSEGGWVSNFEDPESAPSAPNSNYICHGAIEVWACDLSKTRLKACPKPNLPESRQKASRKALPTSSDWRSCVSSPDLCLTLNPRPLTSSN